MKNTRRRAMLTAEAITCLVLMGLILALLAATISRFNDHFDQLTRRAAAWRAAESAWERLRAGHPYSESTFASDFPGKSLAVTRRNASSEWSGFTDLSVHVRAASRRGHAIEARLQGFLPMKDAPR